MTEIDKTDMIEKLEAFEEKVGIVIERIFCDVGSPYPGTEVGPKGWTVRPLKRYASWVQNVVRQFGLYPVQALELLRRLFHSTRGPGRGNHWSTGWPTRPSPGS